MAVAVGILMLEARSWSRIRAASRSDGVFLVLRRVGVAGVRSWLFGEWMALTGKYVAAIWLLFIE